MLPEIESSPSARICLNQRRNSLPVRPTGPPTMTRSPASRPPTTGPVAYAPVRQRWRGTEQVERGERGDDLGGRGEEEGLVGVVREQRRAVGAVDARTLNAKLFAGSPEPRRIAATAGGSALDVSPPASTLAFAGAAPAA
jgi:hypothetical protein